MEKILLILHQEIMFINFFLSAVNCNNVRAIQTTNKTPMKNQYGKIIHSTLGHIFTGVLFLHS